MLFTHFKATLMSSRPPFLLLSPICIYLAASPLLNGTQLDLFHLILILIAGVLAHVSVNTFNEYIDFHSGLDAITTKTPFSGGSGALVAEPKAEKSVLLLAILSLAGTILVGTYFIFNIGWALFPLGVLGVLLIVVYTNWVNKKPLLCLLAPGLAFGPLMMFGTEWVLSQTLSLTGIALAFIPFFMVNNLLLVNQIPDISADKTIGRVTFPIQFGVSASLKVYLLFTLMAGACLLTLASMMSNAIVLVTLPFWSLSIVSWVILKRRPEKTIAIPAMALNVAATLLTPLTLALILHLSH